MRCPLFDLLSLRCALYALAVGHTADYFRDALRARPNESRRVADES